MSPSHPPLLRRASFTTFCEHVGQLSTCGQNVSNRRPTEKSKLLSIQQNVACLTTYFQGAVALSFSNRQQIVKKVKNVASLTLTTYFHFSELINPVFSGKFLLSFFIRNHRCVHHLLKIRRHREKSTLHHFHLFVALKFFFQFFCF